MDRALAEAPGALLEVGLLDELEHAAVAVAGELVLVVGAVAGDRVGVERLAQELVHRGGFADARWWCRRRRGSRARPGRRRRRRARACRRAVSPTIWYGMPHGWANSSRSAPKRSTCLAAMPRLREPVGPVADRLGGHGDVDRLRLVGAALAHPARLAVREGGEDRARVPDAVGVVEVVDRDLAVEEHRLLDALQAERADVEVVVLLRAADAEGQVMGSADEAWVGHPCLLRYLAVRPTYYRAHARSP